MTAGVAEDPAHIGLAGLFGSCVAKEGFWVNLIYLGFVDLRRSSS